MAKNKSNQNWLHDHINDPYVKLAQKTGSVPAPPTS